MNIFLSERSGSMAASMIVAGAIQTMVPSTVVAGSAPDVELETVVVTAPRMSAPLTVVTDPKLPRQPMPAHDGADFLKSIPGFALVRKGGTDGDPVFRGMAASRVNIVVDGEHVLGGCGNRMDPPTAYVFPETYDRVVVTKGPQTVLQGSGVSAATVSFERNLDRFDSRGFEGSASALAGSAGRKDVVADLRAGTPDYFGQWTGTLSAADDYEDGDGERIHSRHERWSTSAAAGWTPDAETRFIVSGALSDGEAAYADRAMDGVKFERENLGIRFERDLAADGMVRSYEAQAFYNYVDHVMDNYSLRTFVPSLTMPGRAVNNPDRETIGLRARALLAWGPRVAGTAGFDAERNQHSIRSTMNQDLRPYAALSRMDDAQFASAGVFGEFRIAAAPASDVVMGLRIDRWRAEDSRRMINAGGPVPDPTAQHVRWDTTSSAFARLEHDIAQSATGYVGLGRVERFPDYWELIPKESLDSVSAFGTRPEKTLQVDVGIVRESERLEFSLSGFYSDVDDFILIESGYAKGPRTTTIARNVAVRTWGGEADFALALSNSTQLTGSLAYTRGTNDTDGLPLAQVPPLEARLAVDHAFGPFSLGALLRAAVEQDRYALKQGSVAGQDLGRTPGFVVASLNGAWKATAGLMLTAGVDNLFDRTYAEHLSRSGAAVSGFEQTARVNEPGRTAWMKLSYRFD